VLWSGSIDRLIVGYQDGRACSAHVIDFKTGGVDSTPDALKQAYGAQLDVYAKSVARQLDLPLTSIKQSLAMLDRGEVLSLDT
jgi:ATP-dependent exoDNAse (exonuclease V) beta subunit